MSEPPPAPPRPPHADPGPGPWRPVREPDDRKIAGVCAGLADHLGVDVTVVRLGVVLLALLTPLAIIAYVAASLLVPERRPDEPRRRAARVHLGRVPHPLLVVAAIVAGAALARRAWWLEPFPAAVALIAVGVWLILQDRDHRGTTDPRDRPPSGSDPDAGTPPRDASRVEHPMARSPWIVTVPQHSAADREDGTTFTDTRPDAGDAGPAEAIGTSDAAGPSGESTPPASPWWSGPQEAPPAPAPPPPDAPASRLGAVVAALLLAGAGLVWLADTLDVTRVARTDAVALGLVAIGVALVVAAWRGRAYSLVPVAVVLAGLLAATDALDVPLDAGAGERVVVVRSADGLAERHELLAGDLTVDLTAAPLARGRRARVEAAVGVGDLRVVVPADVTVAVDATVRLGDVTAPPRDRPRDTGIAVDESFVLDGEPGAPRLELDLSVGLGEVEVVVRD
ncbi:MAG TPA: PspC domain-containing protein [Acidimicrobiales bacterium]